MKVFHLTLGLAVGFVPSLLLSAAECVTCHPAETKLHERTRMAHAMVPALASAFGQNLPAQPLSEGAGGYLISFNKTLSGIEMTAARGEDRATGTIEWVLGAGSQGETPIVRTPTGMLESRVSHFQQLGKYGITIGQNGGASASAPAALGRRQSPRDLQACIGCHATAVTRDLEPVIPGVQCARCHAGAEEHAAGGSKPPFNPGRLAAPEQVRFCGNCHRNQPPLDENQPENVRFQPLRLMESACFGGRKLACTTCHPAHQDARRADPAFYNEKCRNCHSGQSGGLPVHADRRAAGDCVGCHMAKVQLHPALRFTDHYIRVLPLAASAVTRPPAIEPQPAANSPAPRGDSDRSPAPGQTPPPLPASRP